MATNGNGSHVTNGTTKRNDGLQIARELREKFMAFDELLRMTDGFDIGRIRRMLGMSQEDFAHTVGVTHSTAARWEHKKSRVPLDVIVKVSQIVRENA